jgi:hypothetical protein
MVFHLTRAEFDAKKEELRQLGVNITTDTGVLLYKGIKLDYEYLEPTGFLTILIITKPFLISESAIHSRLKSWFSQDQDQDQPPTPPTAA